MKREELERFMAGRDTVFLTCIDAEGFPSTTGMLPPRYRCGILEFHFSTNTSSGKVENFRRNPQACIYFCDRDKFWGLKIKGLIEVSSEPVLKEKLWQAGDEAYYPLGVTDPDYCVLCFKSVSARLYNGQGSMDIDLG